MYSSYGEFVEYVSTILEAEDDDLKDIYLKADRTKVVSALNSAISALPGVINNLKSIGDQLEKAGISGSRAKTASESLTKYLERLKKELNP